MLDQYGDKVPDDLVMLDDLTILDELVPAEEPMPEENESAVQAMVEAIDQLDWYVPDTGPHPGWGGLILVSKAAFDKAVPGYELYSMDEEVGIKLEAVLFVAPGLHRFDLQDGFYTA